MISIRLLILLILHEPGKVVMPLRECSPTKVKQSKMIGPEELRRSGVTMRAGPSAPPPDPK